MDDAEKVRAIRAIIDQRTSDADKVRQIRRVLNPQWTDTGSGAGYDSGAPYDPRD